MGRDKSNEDSSDIKEVESTRLGDGLGEEIVLKMTSRIWTRITGWGGVGRGG